eukprot:2007533-Alexandrium_andersonii.AAC.1
MVPPKLAERGSPAVTTSALTPGLGAQRHVRLRRCAVTRLTGDAPACKAPAPKTIANRSVAET